MNIRLIHSVSRRCGAKALAFTAAAALIALGSGAAWAQTGLVNQVSQMPFGPGTKIVPASTVRTAADVSPNRLAPGAISQAVGASIGDINSGGISQVSFGCQSCSQPSCNGGCNTGCNGNCSSGCNTCGTSSAYGGGYGDGGSMACGIPCNPYYYVNIEALYFERQGYGNRSLIRNTELGDEEFELMPRVTLGALPNCVNGYEFTFVGQTTWKSRVVASDPAGGLRSLLFDGDGLPAFPGDPSDFDGSFLGPFNDAELQVIASSSEYWSAEFNRTLVGWDVAKVLCGARYISIEENFAYASEKTNQAPPPPRSGADLSSRTHNDMLGVQAGLDLLYPISRHFYTDFRGRGGLFIDFADSEVRLRNQGNVILRNFADKSKVNGVFEIGGGLRFQMGDMLSVRAGGELWYITDYASAPGQLNNAVTNSIGSRLNFRDLFFYGITLGAELKF